MKYLFMQKDSMQLTYGGVVFKIVFFKFNPQMS